MRLFGSKRTLWVPSPSVVKVNWYFALNALLQRNERLCRHYAVDALQPAVQQFHQLLVVTGIEFDHHRVGASGEVALHHFGDVHQLLDHILVHRAFLQRDTYIGAGAVAQALGIHVEAAARNDIGIDEVLNALMDSSTRDVTLGSNILERDARIL